jgi:excisionase family DNA binding protein
MSIRLPPKGLFRPDEVARFLCLSRRTVYRMIKDGRLKSVKLASGTQRVPRESILHLFPRDQVNDLRA